VLRVVGHVFVSHRHYQSTLDAIYVLVVPWSEFPIVPSCPHYPQGVIPRRERALRESVEHLGLRIKGSKLRATSYRFEFWGCGLRGCGFGGCGFGGDASARESAARIRFRFRFKGFMFRV